MNINEQSQSTLTNTGTYQSAGTNTCLSNDSNGGASVESTFSNSFKGELEKLIDIDGATGLSDEYDINDILKDIDLADTQNIDTLKMDKNDAMFALNMINQGFGDYSMTKEGKLIETATMKTLDVSKTLNTLLQKANDSKKAIRLDFDNNVTVILKLNNEGKINAHFIPGDKAVEEYLKNNIPYLKQKFEEQNIAYANINYRQHKENRENNNENQNNNKGEQDE